MPARILRIGEAVLAGMPLADEDLPMDDEPFQFAAACVERARALDAGPSFITKLP